MLAIGDLRDRLPPAQGACARGKRLDLTPKEFALLSLLARRARAKCSSRTLIAEQVWDMNFDSDTQRRRRARPPAALEGGRPVREEADPHGRGVGYVLEERD